MTEEAQDWVCLGKLGKPHGVQGELLFWPDDNSPDITIRLLDAAEEVEVRWPEAKPPLKPLRDTLAGARMQGKRLVVALDSLTDRNDVEAMPRHGELWVPAPDIRGTLEEGEMLISDLVGKEVRDAEGTLVGLVADIETGPQDQLLIEADAAWWRARGHDPATTPPKTFRLPYVAQLVDPDTEDGVFKVSVPEGLELI